MIADNSAEDSLSNSSNKDKTIREWLYAAASDLKCAKVLYDNMLFSAALYHLQQSNEKLAKGLLMAIGFLSPKRAKKDLRIKEMLGFLPKEPAAYRHRTMPSFLSNVEKTIPSIDGFLNLVESGELGPRIQEYHLLVRKGKKVSRSLRRKHSGQWKPPISSKERFVRQRLFSAPSMTR
jgi:hypothetical protein